jgi:hypothetical protein
MEKHRCKRMASVAIDPGMPRKVLAKAHQLGVHNDCLISGNLCTQCHDNVMLAFDFFYGTAKDEAELIAAIIEDFRKDLEDEEWE